MSENILIFSEDPRKLIYPLGFASLIKSKLGYNIVAITRESEMIKEIARKGNDEIKLIKGRLTNDQYAEIIIKEIKASKYKYIISDSSSDGNEILARVSGYFNMLMFTEINDISINEAIVLQRKILGGKAISKIFLSKDVSASFTVTFKSIETKIESEPKISYIEEIPKSNVILLGSEAKKTSEVDISQAELVIGVGRGFKKKEDIKLAEELAKLINAQIGSTRPIAADYKWLPEDRWIGISGKTIRPKLYIAIGVSGAPQHIAGILESKVIVAIDKDKNAPIFKNADYCVVADLYEFLPVLIERIKARKSK